MGWINGGPMSQIVGLGYVNNGFFGIQGSG